ncbi:hypothetical protein [Winogradskyella sp.]|uniref:hypothetical protein n=1 Tax=Winogradskyella sp. TaxID=1883156 RepID=UPI00345D916F
MVFIRQKAVFSVADMLRKGMAQLEQLWPMSHFGQHHIKQGIPEQSSQNATQAKGKDDDHKRTDDRDHLKGE